MCIRDSFSTECIYSPEAFRGSARTLIKNLERIRPESILDVVRSGIDMAKLVPTGDGQSKAGECMGKKEGEVTMHDDEEEAEGGCGSGNGQETGGEMVEMEKKLRQDEQAASEATETEIKLPVNATDGQRHDRDRDARAGPPAAALTAGIEGQNHDRHPQFMTNTFATNGGTSIPLRTKPGRKSDRTPAKNTAPPRQKLGQCERCGYLSSQAVCKACMLLEGLNKARPRTGIEVGDGAG